MENNVAIKQRIRINIAICAADSHPPVGEMPEIGTKLLKNRKLQNQYAADGYINENDLH